VEDKLIEVNGLNLDDFGDYISDQDVATAVRSKGDSVVLVIERSVEHSLQYAKKVGIKAIHQMVFPLSLSQRKGASLVSRNQTKT